MAKTPTLFGAALLIALISTAISAQSSPTQPIVSVGQLELVAGNFSWAENLFFDGRGNLFVSDFNRGQIIRFSWLRDHHNNASLIRQVIGRFAGVLGLDVVAAGPTDNRLRLYAVARPFRDDTDEPGDPAIVVASIDNATASQFEVVVNTSIIGNGLAHSNRTASLYTACEGDFIPYFGKILQIPLAVAPPTVRTVASGLFASDGAFVSTLGGDSEFLFVSEVLTATVRVYDTASGALLTSYKAPNMTSLDDFCIITGGLPALAPGFDFWLVGADFTGGRVVAFALTSSGSAVDGSAVVVGEGFQNPTSVRVGVGADWTRPNATSLFVTEGGPLLFREDNRRLWRIDL